MCVCMYVAADVPSGSAALSLLLQPVHEPHAKSQV